MVVKGKDLSYEANEPAFLRRLRAQQAGRGDPDRHERAIPRATRAKVAQTEDDAPTMVDEEGLSVTKEEYEALLRGEGEANTAEDASQPVGTEGIAATTKPDDSKAPSRPLQEAQVGQSQKKRKAVRVVEEDDQDANGEDAAKTKTSSKKPKRKAKAVALSFEDGDG